MNLEISEEQIQAELAKRRNKRMGAVEKPATVPLQEEKGPPRHYLFQDVLSLVEMRENIWMAGPAGSGKSKVAEQVAEALSLPYSAPPVGRETTNAQLFGYFNASGEYVRTPIRQRAEEGGVLHLEEVDFASPAVGTALNALLANDLIGFPDANVKRHPDFIVIASANTYGNGANATYIGSQGLNAATLDRFVFMDFPYDEIMECRIAPNRNWARHVQSVRRKVAKLGLKHVVSPRATIKGGKMINSQKFSIAQTEAMVLFRSLDNLTIEKIRATSDVL